MILGVSFIFGDEFLSSVVGKGVDKVESMIRTREADYVCLRLQKGG